MAKRLTPIKAIRANCIECSGGSLREVRECHITDCALWPYRMGTHPERKGMGGNIANLTKKPVLAGTN